VSADPRVHADLKGTVVTYCREPNASIALLHFPTATPPVTVSRAEPAYSPATVQENCAVKPAYSPATVQENCAVKPAYLQTVCVQTVCADGLCADRTKCPTTQP
jgi:hypothetical protein